MVGSKEDYIVALDLGSSFVRTLVVQIIPEGTPRIVGVGVVASEGIRRGAIADLEEVTGTIRKSIDKAQQSSGVEIKSAYVSVGGMQVEATEAKGVVAVGRADGEVMHEDLERVISASQAINLPPNREILHIIPQNFRLDDQEDIKDPLGMNGVRLEMQGLIITGFTPHLRNLAKCVSNNGVEVEGFIVSPLASAKTVLNKRQKELGVVVVDLGGGTTSLAVYEEQELLHTAILPVGAGYITNDVAIGLRTSIDTAEKIKLKYGSALPAEVDSKEEINLAEIDENEEGAVSRKHVAEIIEARLEEMFYLVEKELKKINRSALLPAGVVLTGGGACTQGAVDLAKEILKLPVQIGFPHELSGLIDKVDNPSFSVSVGMVTWILEDAEEMIDLANQESGRGKSSKLPSMKGSVNTMRKWFGKFLP